MARPAMRLRLAPMFPVKVLSGTAIEVARTGGSITINMDWSAIQQEAMPVDPENYEFTLLAADGSFIRVPVSDIILTPITWDTLTGKPSEFPPSAHSQDIASIIGLQTALNAPTITGGTINGAPIGGTTPAAGAFTSALIAMGADNVTGLSITGGSAGARMTIGTDASANVLIRTQNAVDLRFGVGTNTWLTVNNAGTVTAAGAFSGPTTGVAAASNASAGQVGEYVSSSIVSGSAVALTTATGANVTSISLTAGDWDVWVNARFTGAAGTTVTVLQAGISTTSATLSTTPGQVANTFHNGQTPFATTTLDIAVGAIRLSLASTTTVYFVAQASFAVSTCSAFGVIQARRRR